VSAPDHRVDLEALKRPRLGGKEPSDEDYRLRFTHALPAGWAHYHNPTVHRVTVKFVSTILTCGASANTIEKLRYMPRNPAKRGLVERPEQWRWSSFRSYLYGEVGAVRVNYQEWPLGIERRPVEKFNDENRPPRPLIRKNRE
jgi:hypothetical protein